MNVATTANPAKHDSRTLLFPMPIILLGKTFQNIKQNPEL